MIRNCLFIFVTFLVMNCSEKRPETGLDQFFYETQRDYMIGNYGSSSENFSKLVKEQTGSKYASAAYLILAESALTSLGFGDLEKAEIYYRLFLDTNSGSELVPFVYSRLILVHYLKNENRLFVRNTDYKPFEQIINEYKIFYFLYPNSIYFKDLAGVYQLAENKIGNIEESIGDWYFKKKLYSSASNRYLYILTNYPNYSNVDEVSRKFLSSLELDNQLDLKEEYEKSFNLGKDLVK